MPLEEFSLHNSKQIKNDHKKYWRSNKSILVIMLTIIFISLFNCSTAECLNQAQINQLNDIARKIADQYNSTSYKHLDSRLLSTKAVAIGYNVQFEYVLFVKKGTRQNILEEASNEIRRSVILGACDENSRNEAFNRGLYYTFKYTGSNGEKIANFNVNKTLCTGLNIK
jgi:hypothetical protein